MENDSLPGQQKPAWGPLVAEIVAGDTDAMGKLYTALRPLRYYFCQRIGETEGEDAFHELIIDLFTQLRRGLIHNPECLGGYARSMASNKLAGRIRQRAFSRQHETAIEDGAPLRGGSVSPEGAAIRSEQEKIAMRILLSVPARDREVLVRFYFREEAAEQIQSTMQLTPTQFRLIKSRAKARFTELCHTRFANRHACPETVNPGGRPVYSM